MTNLSVLIIDDEVSFVDMLKDHIEDEFEVETSIKTAHDGIEALQESSSEQFDVILCDYNMPKMNGKDFFKTIRTTENPNKETLVIFISATMNEITKDRPENLHNAFFLDKPIKLERLNRYINLVLAKKGQE